MNDGGVTNNLITKIESVSGDLAAAAQRVYDSWVVDEDGYDEEVGSGGICHLIADAFCNVLNKAGVDCTTVSSSHEVHVFTLALDTSSKIMIFIDIPHFIYETGGGYTWKKVPDVEFDSGQIVIDDWSYMYDDYIDEDGYLREF